MKMTSWFPLFIKGLAIGGAAIIPGISGGTIAFMLGIYDQIIFAIVNLKSSFLKSMHVLIPVGLGAITAIGLLTIPLSLAFTYAPLATVSLFAGLIIGHLPTLRQNLPKRFSQKQLFMIIIPALTAALLGVGSVVGQLDASAVLTTNEWMIKFVLIFVGFLGVSAFIVPGISGSMLLLSIGFYEPILNSVKNLLEHINDWANVSLELLNFSFLVVGFLIGFFVLSFLMAHLLKHFRLEVNLGVFGFIVGSLFSIYINYEIITVYQELWLWEIGLAITTLIMGFFLSRKLLILYAAR